MYTKLICGMILACAAVCLPAAAQPNVNGVRIFTEPAADVDILIDGQSFIRGADLPWPSGSKHVVTSYDQVLGTMHDRRFSYKGYKTNLMLPEDEYIRTQPITASPGLKWIKLKFTLEYLLSIAIDECPIGGQPCLSPGRVQIVRPEYCSGIYDHSKQCWIGTDEPPVEVRAFPNSSYVFSGWESIPSLPFASRPDFIISFTMTEPVHLFPQFRVASPVKASINVQSVPPQMKVLLDRTPYDPPVNLEWGWGTVHALGVDPVQQTGGLVWVFDSWSDGGSINHDFQVPSYTKAIDLVARFVQAHTISFQTSPPNLPLSIDALQNGRVTFDWAPGTVHKISAPATATDEQGRKYRFASWSNGRPAAFDYTAGPAPGGDRIIATYQLLGQATIASQPSNLPVQVDGVECKTPCTVERDSGTSVRIAATPMLNSSEQSRLVFRGWSDSSAESRVLELSADKKTYTAAYIAQNRLATLASPSEGASFATTPASPDGFYDAGSTVSVAATAALGYRIAAWSGDAAGSAARTEITLDAPKTAVLMLDRVPAIAPLGVRSAATSAAPDSVAPGSLISIFGANLAPGSEVGPPNPLAQTLQAVTVRVGGTFLPLIFVSPEQINAQLPAGIAEGAQTLTVQSAARAETSAPVMVSRNAPGLFGGGDPAQPAGYFLRAGGEPVTPDRPARAGEVITVLGTGFGPYTAQPPDGFLLDEAAGYTVLDPVKVSAGGAVLDAVYAGRSAAGVGVDGIRFQLPAALPDSPVLSVKVSVNGRDSNTVFLPVTR